ncbi:MAG: TRAP transporter large permease [Alphaproteobacteria bacterium]|jgi:tripartite ATP-independent transporter DctM subunit|nr:TRAP transporter large permease [Alphaproteobacteria bacterium]MBO6863842.1 TRAP transporter large permease [Alphaproteobacteria bacterium]MEC9267015.1 TRAP transporter large permease [Pseudomonadota bacterium]
MDPHLIGYLGFVVVLILLAFRVPIAIALGSVATGGMLLTYAWTPWLPFSLSAAVGPVGSLLSTTPIDFINSYALSTVPLFIFIGHLAFQAGFTTDIYAAARVWLARMPGGLAIASIVGCGGFSAISGSSVACAAAMGRIAVPEMLESRYSRTLASGSVAIGGTLGSLIPPSILFIIFGVFAEQSIAKLFLAAAIPGLLTLLGYIVVVMIWVRLRPDSAPMPDLEIARSNRGEALARCWPILMLFAVIIGGIYLGAFTPTEAAGVGAAATLALGLVLRRLDLGKIGEALREAVTQSAQLFAIAIAGKLFVNFIALTNVATQLTDWIAAAELSVFLVIGLIALLYIVLGMMLDPLGIILLTLPLTLPVVESYGLDLIWWGVIVVKLLEIGLVTPPIGLNVFVIKSIVGDKIPLERIFTGVSYFLISDFFVMLLLLFFPILSLFLPSLL